MEAHTGLAVLEGGELLCARRGDGAVARDDLLHQAAHRLDAERERNHVEQQPVFALRLVAGEDIGLHGGAERHHLVGVQVVERVALEEVGHRALDLRHARRTADHHHALHVVDGEPRIAQRLAHRTQGLLHQRLRDAAERLGIERDVDEFAGGELRRDLRLAVQRQVFLGLARAYQQEAHVARRKRRELGLLDDPAEHALVEIISAEHRVAARRHDLEYAA